MVGRKLGKGSDLKRENDVCVCVCVCVLEEIASKFSLCIHTHEKEQFKRKYINHKNPKQ